ncbi:MAG: hypothetical protein C4293_03930 [Nitrospiraceae bacterium]
MGPSRTAGQKDGLLCAFVYDEQVWHESGRCSGEGAGENSNDQGRIILAIFLVGCVPLVIGLFLAYMSGMRSLRDVIGGNFQVIAEQAADRMGMLVQAEIQRMRLLASAPLRVRQPVSLTNQTYPADAAKAASLIKERMAAWKTGTAASEGLLNSELSRFLNGTKVRDGDKMAGLLIRNVALIAIVIVDLLAAIGRYVGTRIARPIQALRQGVEAISQGTYDRPLDIGYPDGRRIRGAGHRGASDGGEAQNVAHRTGSPEQSADSPDRGEDR